MQRFNGLVGPCHNMPFGNLLLEIQKCVETKQHVLLIGPLGSGKAHLARLAFGNHCFCEISFASLLCPSEFASALYESPRQKLSRLMENAALSRQAILFTHIEEFVGDLACWWTLQEWLPRLLEPVIFTINDKAACLKLLRERIPLCFFMPERITAVGLETSTNLRFADLVEVKRIAAEEACSFAEAAEVLTREGRTCAQIENDSNLMEAADNSADDKLTLDRVFGVAPEIKEALLKHASFTFGDLNARGAVLYGPPGTGKTRLALALASSLGRGTRLIVLSAADLLRSEVGSSEQRLREAFALARASQPALIFFDEVEALFPEAPTSHLQTLLQQCVAEFDSIELEEAVSGERIRIFVLAATNFLKRLSKRLLQAGRLEMQIYLGLPSESERFEIICNELLREDDDSLSPDVLQFRQALAAQTADKSPADLMKLVREARKASRGPKLTVEDFK